MQEALSQILFDYPAIAPIVFILVRAIPVIIPPIPGIVIDVVGIAVFGWLYGFFLAGFGVMLGSMVSFYIARYLREPFLNRFTSLKKIHAWEAHFSENQKLWHLVWLRIITGPFFDYICYAAGLTKMKARTFFWSTFLSATPMGLAIYYFGDTSFAQGPLGIIIFVLSLLVLALISKRISKQKTLN